VGCLSCVVCAERFRTWVNETSKTKSSQPGVSCGNRDGNDDGQVDIGGAAPWYRCS